MTEQGQLELTDLKPETSLQRVRRFILTHQEFTNIELSDYMRYHPGALSFRTRIADVRKELETKGGGIVCDPVDASRGVYKYTVIMPR